jgi:hypothetical protein
MLPVIDGGFQLEAALYFVQVFPVRAIEHLLLFAQIIRGGSIRLMPRPVTSTLQEMMGEEANVRLPLSLKRWYRC